MIGWTALSGAIGYEYNVSTSATPPTTGIPTNTNSFQATNLNSATQYYAHVRVQCGPGRYSKWFTRSFVTTCFKPSLFITALTPAVGTIDLGWNKIANVSNYEYAILDNELSPPGSLSSTVDTIVHLTGLVGGGKYYLHVRTHCQLGSVSSWSVMEFHTTGLAVYPNPAGNLITLTIYGENATGGEISVVNVNGQIMTKLRLSGNSTRLNIGSYASGIYFLKYYKGKNYVTQIVKQ
jgi:hypothetical protein